MKIVFRDEMNNSSGVTNVYNLERAKNYYILHHSKSSDRYSLSYVNRLLEEGKWVKLYIEEE